MIPIDDERKPHDLRFHNVGMEIREEGGFKYPRCLTVLGLAMEIRESGFKYLCCCSLFLPSCSAFAALRLCQLETFASVCSHRFVVLHLKR